MLSRRKTLPILVFFIQNSMLYCLEIEDKFAQIIVPLKSTYSPGEVIACLDISKITNVKVFVSYYYLVGSEGTTTQHKVARESQVFMIPKEARNSIYIECNWQNKTSSLNETDNVYERKVIQRISLDPNANWNEDSDILTSSQDIITPNTIYHCDRDRFIVKKLNWEVEKFLEFDGAFSTVKVRRAIIEKMVHLFCGINEMTIGKMWSDKTFSTGENSMFSEMGDDFKCQNKHTPKNALFYWEKLLGPDPGLIQYNNGILYHSINTKPGFYRYRCRFYLPKSIPEYSKPLNIIAKSQKINLQILNPKYYYQYGDEILCQSNSYPETKVDWLVNKRGLFNTTHLPNAAVIHFNGKSKYLGKQELTCFTKFKNDGSLDNRITMEIELQDKISIICSNIYVRQIVKILACFNLVVLLLSLVKYLIPFIWLHRRNKDEPQNGYIRMDENHFFLDVKYMLEKYRNKALNASDTEIYSDMESLSGLDSLASDHYRGTGSGKESIKTKSTYDLIRPVPQTFTKIVNEEKFLIMLNLMVYKFPEILNDQRKSVLAKTALPQKNPQD